MAEGQCPTVWSYQQINMTVLMLEIYLTFKCIKYNHIISFLARLCVTFVCPAEFKWGGQITQWIMLKSATVWSCKSWDNTESSYDMLCK